jgi:hypothetical protein
MESFLDQPSDDSVNIVTPESLAWKLLMDEDVKEYAGTLIPFVSGDQELSHNSDMRYEQLSDQFQILITLYMEMVYGLLKINHIASGMNDHGGIDDTIDLEKTFNPDLSKFGVDDMLILFREKLKKIKMFLSVREIFTSDPTNPRDYGFSSEYYCRIILKDTPDGVTYFWNNRNNPAVNSAKKYTFVMRDDKKKENKKLNDFYAVCVLPNIKVQISFSPINVMVQKPHII